jgi:hypothetical protein
MRFQKRQQDYSTPRSLIKPVLGLVKEEAYDKEQKDRIVTFDLKIRAGGGQATPNYKKYMKTFEEGNPQEWMDALTGFREIWRQNSVNAPHDRAATVGAILKGDSLAAFNTALEDARVDPDPDEDEEFPEPLELDNDHVDIALSAVTEVVFPFRALEDQKNWMNRYMRKPHDLCARKTDMALARLNNYLPLFPGGTVASKFSDAELISIFAFSIPDSWRRALDLKGFNPSEHTRKELVAALECIERNEIQKGSHHSNNHHNSNNNNNNRNKKNKFGKNGNNNKKNDRNENSGDGKFFCKTCGPNGSHNTNRCFKRSNSNSVASNGSGKAQAKPYSKRTFRKEVNAMARRAGKHDGLKIVESALKREQGKLAKAAKTASKKAKAAAAKKPESDSDSSSDDDSVHNMEAPIPRKNRKEIKTLSSSSKTIRFCPDASSDSDGDKKMPAKVSKKSKKAPQKKSIFDDLMDMESEDENMAEGNKATAEERAFLKSVNREEKKAKNSKNSSDESD